jgi:hypothetical protein
MLQVVSESLPRFATPKGCYCQPLSFESMYDVMMPPFITSELSHHACVCVRGCVCLLRESHEAVCGSTLSVSFGCTAQHQYPRNNFHCARPSKAIYICIKYTYKMVV